MFYQSRGSVFYADTHAHTSRVTARASSFVTMNKPPVTDTISGAVLHRVPSDPSTIGVL